MGKRKKQHQKRIQLRTQKIQENRKRLLKYFSQIDKENTQLDINTPKVNSTFFGQNAVKSIVDVYREQKSRDSLG